MPRLRVTVDAWSAIPDSVLIEFVFPYATFEDGSALRLTCKAFLRCTKMTPFCDRSGIVFKLNAWVACFPMAKHLTLQGDGSPFVIDFDLSHLETCAFLGSSRHELHPKSILAKATCLQKVAVDYMELDDEFMGLLSGIPSVSLTNVFDFYSLTEKGFLSLQGVEELEITAERFTPPMTSFEHVRLLSRLRRLKLSIEGVMVDETFSILKSLPLEELRIKELKKQTYHPLTDQAFIDMAGIQTVELSSRNFHLLQNISTRGFQALGGRQTVETFDGRDTCSGRKFSRVAGVDNSAKTYVEVNRYAAWGKYWKTQRGIEYGL